MLVKDKGQPGGYGPPWKRPPLPPSLMSSKPGRRQGADTKARANTQCELGSVTSSSQLEDEQNPNL